MLNSPYGGALVDLLEPADRAGELARHAATLPSIQLSARSECDLELLATGAFSPLDRFMGQADYLRVVKEMRLANGTLFPIPITLPIDSAAGISLHDEVALRSARQELLAVMRVDDVYAWDREEAARYVCGTTDRRHPFVAEMDRWGALQISGPIRVLRLPRHHDFAELRRTPAEVRARLQSMNAERVVAFQTRNPIHRAHEEMTHRAMDSIDGVLLLHPVVGLTKPGDIDHYTRVRTYKALIEKYYPQNRALLSLLPLAMRMAGPREALWHGLIRRNYGASHFIVGRDHASPGPFYGAYDAQKLFAQHEQELGVTMIPFRQLVYVDGKYEEETRETSRNALTISGTQVRDDYLARGRALPEWFTRPEIAAILGEAHPPRHRQGVCVWFTGLSGAGKTTTADVLVARLLEHGRQSTVLDGDVVRTHLSKGLGFSKEDRDANVLRIAFVAAEVVRHGGVAVCAAVSPYRATRDAARAMVGADRFIEVFVDTPLPVCEQRDVKGMYAQARAGIVAHFTGISDPYEAPLAPEITLDTETSTADVNAQRIIDELRDRGYIVSHPTSYSA